MPPASGVALGFDRLVMLATGAPRIEQVLWTPVVTGGAHDAMLTRPPDAPAPIRLARSARPLSSPPPASSPPERLAGARARSPRATRSRSRRPWPR